LISLTSYETIIATIQIGTGIESGGGQSGGGDIKSYSQILSFSTTNFTNYMTAKKLFRIMITLNR